MAGRELNGWNRLKEFMNIVYILEYFPKLSETFILNEILELQNRGVKVDVYAFEKADEKMAHYESRDVNSVRYFPRRSLWGKLYGHLYWLIRNPLRYLKVLRLAFNQKNQLKGVFLRNLNDVRDIERIGPQHIHAHFSGAASDMAMLVFLMTGIPYTFTTHGSDIFFYPPENFKLKTQLAKKHVSISEYNKAYLTRKFGLDETKIDVIHCGIDAVKIAAEYPRQSNGINKLLTIARLEKFKGLENLVLACRNLKDQGVLFHCDIIGEGRERQKLADLIKSNNLDKEICLLGSKTRQEVYRYLSKASLKILPSRSEGIPIVLMEAMALKVPVIASNINGIPELVEDNQSGLLVDPENPESLAQRIKCLLAEKELQKRFTEKGFETVTNKFNLNKSIDKLCELWKG